MLTHGRFLAYRHQVPLIIPRPCVCASLSSSIDVGHRCSLVRGRGDGLTNVIDEFDTAIYIQTQAGKQERSHVVILWMVWQAHAWHTP